MHTPSSSRRETPPCLSSRPATLVSVTVRPSFRCILLFAGASGSFIAVAGPICLGVCWHCGWHRVCSHRHLFSLFGLILFLPKRSLCLLASLRRRVAVGLLCLSRFGLLVN